MIRPGDIGQFNAPAVRVDPAVRVGHHKAGHLWFQTPDTTLLHCTVNFMDNLNIRGIEDDKPRRRGKKRVGRKPFAIEARLVDDPDVPKHSVMRQIGLGSWSVWGRYETAFRRDQAYATLVKKEATNNLPRWSRWEFKKHND